MDKIKRMLIDVSDNEGICNNIELEFSCMENDELIYVSKESKRELKVSINKTLSAARLINKSEYIVDRNCDIEHRVLEAAFEAKENLDETTANGFDDADEVEQGSTDIDPYDPKLIRVDPKNFSVQMVIDMIRENEIDLAPAFQRRFVWNDITKKSRLIESLLLRIPIPVFYFAQDEDGLFQVVDGVQRLTVLNSFMNNEFKLKNLEYLHDCEGKWYKKNDRENSIDSLYTRRIEQTQLHINIIDPQTPNKVKYDIFRRINTGGKELNNQEIRNCLANSKTRELLRSLSESDEFKKATRGSVKPTRMADEELVLRFIAFYLIDNGKSTVTEYKGGMNVLLDSTVEVLNKTNIENYDLIKDAFLRAMELAYYIFGDNSFRKVKYINKSLFLGLSRVLCKYTLDDIKGKNIVNIKNKIDSALTESGELWTPLSLGTNDARNVNFVYKFINDVLES